MNNIKRMIKRIMRISLCAGVLVLIYALAVNFFVIIFGRIFIRQPEKIKEKYEYIIVPGCAIRNGRPSDMLRDRLDMAIELYTDGAAEKIIVSGAADEQYYSEPAVMKRYLTQNGVPEEAVITDLYGFSTYETVYRAKRVYNVGSAVFVTQKYHLYRTVFLAKRFGIDALGVGAMPNTYVKQVFYSLREILARNKDFLFSFIKPGKNIPNTI